MKNFFLGILFFFTLNHINAQSSDYGSKTDTMLVCVALSGNNFSSDTAAEKALDKILNVIGATRRFVLQACNSINNAYAITYKGIRYIIYDPKFMQTISNSNDWVNTFILAHEVGHHINGHTVDVLIGGVVDPLPLSQRRTQELEADQFAGFILGRLGADLNDALLSVASLSDEDDSYSTHPNKSKRIAAITKGFNESGGLVDSSKSVDKGEVIDSKYSNSRYAGVTYVILNNYYADAIYEGYVSVESNQPFGYGTYYGNNGTVYKGEFSGSKFNGYGTYTQSNGYSEEGFFVNGNLTKGQIVWSDGGKSVGNFTDGGLDGDGIIYEADGTTIDGIWSSCPWCPTTSTVDINVTISDSSGTTIKSGFFDGSNGKGFGTFTDKNGGTLKANFKDGAIAPARGMFLWNQGYDSYYGFEKRFDKKTRKNLSKKGLASKSSFNIGASILDFMPSIVRGSLNIKNPYTESVSSSLSCRELKENNGRIIWNVESKDYVRINIPQDCLYVTYLDIDATYKNHTYIGDQFGYGIYRFSDGSLYNGYFRAGTRNMAGYGEIVYNSNDMRKSYSGIWWNGKKNGYGQLTYKDGRVNKGIFINDEFFKGEDFDLQLIQLLLKDF